ncbi:hypothetical protein BGZ63DRAFT_403326 [Mariannaea sp. PMI_226]|nr:hypothetical protein BGZ63DRAFT_403326 [Mariannaea sp. PMI_226]
MDSLPTYSGDCLVLGTTSVQRLPFEVIYYPEFRKRNVRDLPNEEFFMVVDTVNWFLEECTYKKVYQWVKDIEYHKYWRWTQRYRFKKILQQMLDRNSGHPEHVSHAFNIKLAKLGIMNVRVISHEQGGYQFFALSAITNGDRVGGADPFIQEAASPLRSQTSTIYSVKSLGETYTMNVAPWADNDPVKKILYTIERPTRTSEKVHRAVTVPERPIPGAWVMD